MFVVVSCKCQKLGKLVRLTVCPLGFPFFVGLMVSWAALVSRLLVAVMPTNSLSLIWAGPTVHASIGFAVMPAITLGKYSAEVYHQAENVCFTQVGHAGYCPAASQYSITSFAMCMDCFTQDTCTSIDDTATAHQLEELPNFRKFEDIDLAYIDAQHMVEDSADQSFAYQCDRLKPKKMIPDTHSDSAISTPPAIASISPLEELYVEAQHPGENFKLYETKTIAARSNRDDHESIKSVSTTDSCDSMIDADMTKMSSSAATLDGSILNTKLTDAEQDTELNTATPGGLNEIYEAKGIYGFQAYASSLCCRLDYHYTLGFVLASGRHMRVYSYR